MTNNNDDMYPPWTYDDCSSCGFHGLASRSKPAKRPFVCETCEIAERASAQINELHDEAQTYKKLLLDIAKMIDMPDCNLLDLPKLVKEYGEESYKDGFETGQDPPY